MNAPTVPRVLTRTLSAARHARERGLVSAALLQLVFLLGLSGVFLANAVVAVVEPGAFQELVAACPIGGLMDDGAWIAPVIAINDFVIGSAVLASHRVERLRAPVLAWAGAWFLIVTLMKLTTLG